MKKTRWTLAVVALILSMTTLSLLHADETASVSPEQLNTLVIDTNGELAKSQSETVTVYDAVGIPEVLDVGKDIIDGDGFDWLSALLALVPAIFIGLGWLLDRLKFKKDSILLATAYEGGQAITAGLTYLATRRKEDFNKAVKEAKDVVLVPRSMLKEKRE